MADLGSTEFEAGYYDHSPYSVLSDLPEYNNDDQDYDPEAYGPQTLLMFDGSESVRPMVFDLDYDYKADNHQQHNGFDHSSPSSNGDNRSRGSSVSSHSYMQGSPNMDAAFAQLNFAPPPEKAMSPPALVIPETETATDTAGPRLSIIPATPLSPAEANISSYRPTLGDFISNQSETLGSQLFQILN